MKFDVEGEEIERWPMGFRRKRTRRWCRGRPGIEHKFKEVVWFRFPKYIIYWIEECTNCGRHGAVRIERLEK